MKKQIQVLALMAVLISMMAPLALAAPKNIDVVRIKDGVLEYSAGHFLEGEAIPLGFDAYGYNYQGHMFKGSYANIYLGRDGFEPYTGDDVAYLAENPDAATKWYWPYRDTLVLMKWNDAWLSNMDRDGDGALDRHYGFDSYVGSGAWETNHMFGEYEDEGNIIKWNYFTKIVAVPDDAENVDGVWHTVDGTEIGPVIWGEFATIMEVSNDAGLDEHGLLYLSPFSAGFGAYAP